MKPLPLSVAVITLNEEEHLQRCLESVSGLASEIVVVDSGSTDRTPEIARNSNALFEVAPWTGFMAQKNRALRRCSQPWVLSLDADEALTPELVVSIRDVLGRADSGVAGFEMNRRTFYLGDWIWHAWYPEWILRLVRRDAARWNGLDPHPKMEVDGATARLGGDLLHYSFRDLQDHLQRTIQYSQRMAQSYAAEGRRFRWRFLLLSPGAAVFKHLILKQGWRDGWRGWLVSMIRGVDVFSKYAFLLEHERVQPLKKQRK
jgi:glycosyltransferase involved in cell wall biosynthesis